MIKIKENALKVYPVMLPTDEDSTGPHLWTNIPELKKYWHLYFVSEEPPQEGDWYVDYYYSGEGVSLKRCERITSEPTEGNWIFPNKQTDNGDGEAPKDVCRKVVATTDRSLSLPLIPEEWIRDKWVASQGKIEYVYIEMVSGFRFDLPDVATYSPRISPPNQVIILS